MTLTNFAEDRTLNWQVGNTVNDPPVPPFSMALIDTNGNEITGGSYARQTTNFGTASNGKISNSDTIQFLDMPASTIASVDIYDSNNNKWFIGYTNQNFEDGDIFELAPGALVIKAD